MIKILGFCGRKQSGKDTLANYLLNSPNKFLGKKIGKYAFADYLKEICMTAFGLSHEQCYGTDDQKNTLTQIKWENLPHVITPQEIDYFENYETSWGSSPGASAFEGINLTIHESGFMTAREVLQHVGTEIFRRMREDVWTFSCLQRIKKDKPHLALITDVRFPNEAEAIKRFDHGEGRIIKLTRFIDVGDSHASENSLDNYNNFDEVIDNKNMTVAEQNKCLLEILRKWGWVEG